MSPRTKRDNELLTGAALRQAIREEIERQMEEGREDGASGKQVRVSSVEAEQRDASEHPSRSPVTGVAEKAPGDAAPRPVSVPAVIGVLAPSSLPSFPCSFCPESFPYQVELLAHDLAVHLDGNVALADARLRSKTPRLAEERKGWQ